VQVALEVAARDVDQVPGLQLMHTFGPVASAVDDQVPALQWLHVLLAKYSPIPQVFEQEADDVEPVVDVYCPKLHAMQVILDVAPEILDQ